MLVGELKKIEARKKERERKTQDLQKLISQADSQSETPRKTDKKLPKKKISNPSRPSKVDTTVITKVRKRSTFYEFALIFCLMQDTFCCSKFYKQRKAPALSFRITKTVVFLYVRNA